MINLLSYVDCYIARCQSSNGPSHEYNTIDCGLTRTGRDAVVRDGERVGGGQRRRPERGDGLRAPVQRPAARVRRPRRVPGRHPAVRQHLGRPRQRVLLLQVTKSYANVKHDTVTWLS